MRRSLYISSLFSLLLLLQACVEAFDPEIEKYEELLVVDGLLGEGEEPVVVRLSRSTAYNDLYKIPEEGALVEVINGRGERITLSEGEPGSYSSEPGTLHGEPGQSYHVEIVTTDGSSYQSDPVVLKSAQDPDRFYWEYEEVEGESSLDLSQGINFYVDTRDSLNDALYYRWEYVETWIFNPPISSASYLNRYTCWQEDSTRNILIASTAGLTEDVIERQHILYTGGDSEKLKVRYSLEVKQYVMDESCYEYWKQIEKINEGGGSLYDITPAEVRGNVYNVNKEEEPVLGYFQVCGRSSSRLFVDRSDLPDDFYTVSRTDCELVKVPDSYQISDFLARGLFYIDHVYDEINGFPQWVYRFSNKPSCYDCTVRGSNKKPDFWIDE